MYHCGFLGTSRALCLFLFSQGFHVLLLEGAFKVNSFTFSWIQGFFTSCVTACLVNISCYLEDVYDPDFFRMALLTHDTQRFANAMECIFKLSGLFCGLSALVFEIVIASSHSWRLWEFNSKVVQFVSFGLWEAYYPQEFNVSGTVTKMLVHTPINSTWTISPEFQYAQIMIVWAILMKLVVLIFGAAAIKISCMEDPFVEMEMYCYKVSALFLCVSSLFTLVSVSWNHFADHYGQTTLDFPPDFPVRKEALINKQYTAVFPTAVLTTTMSLFGVIFLFSEIRSLKVQSQVKIQSAYIVAEQEISSESSCI